MAAAALGLFAADDGEGGWDFVGELAFCFAVGAISFV